MNRMMTPEQLVIKAKKVEEKIKVKKEFSQIMADIRLNFGLVLGFILYIFTLGLVFGFIEFSVLGVVRLTNKIKTLSPKKQKRVIPSKKDVIIKNDCCETSIDKNIIKEEGL